LIDKISLKIPLFIAFSLFLVQVQAQEAGCTDPFAKNFNPSATNNDGSCVYTLTLANPPLAYTLSNAVSETSALVFAWNKLWTINDSGGEAVLYGMDTATGQIVQELRIANAKNVDWEELAIDEDYMYIGDVGNNGGTRTDLVIYKVSLHDFPAAGNGILMATSITYRYPDQKIFTRSKQLNFDCEAFIAFEDSLYLFSKNREDQKTTLYRLPNHPGNYIADWVTSFDSKGLITGAAFHAKANELVLIGYVQGIYTPFVWLFYDFQRHNFFSGNKRRIDFPNLITVQTEGICYLNRKQLMISAEKSPTTDARIFRFNTTQWTDSIRFTKELKASKRGNIQVMVKPTVSEPISLLLCDVPKGDYRLNISDLQGEILFQTHVLVSNEKEQQFQFTLPQLLQGRYLVSFIHGSRMLSETFVIQ